MLQEANTNGWEWDDWMSEWWGGAGRRSVEGEGGARSSCGDCVYFEIILLTPVVNKTGPLVLASFNNSKNFHNCRVIHVGT